MAPLGPTPGGGFVPPAAVPPATGWGPAPVMPGPVTTVAPKAGRRRDPLSIVLVIAAFVALGGVGFAFGRVTAPTAVATGGGRGFGGGNGTFEFPAGGFGGNGGGTIGGGGGFGRGLGGAVAIRGTVTAITDTQVTIQLASGGTVNIPISSSTTYHNQASGSASDVKTGATILVQLGAATGPNASPGASPGTGGGRSLGTAQDITIVAQ
ncbi:MAG TPA: hypothetical protein VK656_05800 [Candidatus Acidoferrum sp.]|nr:hypothetical protein [Candidatus Acidoferrum sp.]